MRTELERTGCTAMPVMAENPQRGSREPEKNNELVVFTKDRKQWIYFKTSASTICGAFKEISDFGVNLDNLNIGAYELRDSESNTIEIEEA